MRVTHVTLEKERTKCATCEYCRVGRDVLSLYCSHAEWDCRNSLEYVKRRCEQCKDYTERIAQCDMTQPCSGGYIPPEGTC